MVHNRSVWEEIHAELGQQFQACQFRLNYFHLKLFLLDIRQEVQEREVFTGSGLSSLKELHPSVKIILSKQTLSLVHLVKQYDNAWYIHTGLGLVLETHFVGWSMCEFVCVCVCCFFFFVMLYEISIGFFTFYWVNIKLMSLFCHSLPLCPSTRCPQAFE